MTARLPISPLQFDLATAVLRMAQVHELGPDSPGGGHLVDRLLECDLPRLRAHLDAAGRALIAAADGDGPLPVRLHPPAGEAEPSPEQLAKIAALPDGSVTGVLEDDASILDLARSLLKDLDAHATSGQWRYQGGDEVLVFPADGGMAVVIAEVWGEPREERAIGSFIAVSRQLMPALVAEIERLGHRARMDDLAYKGQVERAEKAEANVRGVYRERASLVAHLAAVYPSHVGFSDPAAPEWPVVTVETQAGQMTWHIAPEDRDLFGHVQPTPQFARDWDGHATEEKYRRLADLTDRESGRGDQRRGFVPAMLGDLDQLTASVARVRTLHTEFKIYGDCGHHDHDDGIEVVGLVEGGETCQTSPLYSVCRHCCAPGDGLSYDHEDGHDASDCWPCPTIHALEPPAPARQSKSVEAALDGTEEDR